MAKSGEDLLQQLLSGQISVGLYHTAGKGTRMAPLPGAENNNKPGVKLPAVVSMQREPSMPKVEVPITILEAVLKQTGCYAKSRPGRLSVFWGDQIFVPTVSVDYVVTHHVDILCSLGPMPSESEWVEKGLDKYGLIAQNATGGAAQVEKVDFATANKLLGKLRESGEISKVGASLGSFSVSSAMLQLLLTEFQSELETKTGKLDSDPHLWMPMTLDREAYLEMMAQKKSPEDFSSAHYERIANMMARFNAVESNRSLGLFGPVDVGLEVPWWDYGQLKLYQKNTMLMTENTPEADLMRTFFQIAPSRTSHDSVLSANTEKDAHSCISSCVIGSEEIKSTITKSVLSNVHCRHLEAEGCVLINVTAESIVAKPGSIIYNVFVAHGGPPLVAEAGDVLAGVTEASGTQVVMKSHLEIDGGKAWETVVSSNAASFEQIYNANATVHPGEVEETASGKHNELRVAMGTTKV